MRGILVALLLSSPVIAAGGLPGAILYAATNHGVYQTSDGGATWIAANFGLPDAPVFSLAIDPSNPQILYAGTNGNRIFKSITGGQLWSPASSGLSDNIVLTLAVDPYNPATVYAGTATSEFFPVFGVAKSTNAGQTWAVANSGLPAGIITSLVVDPFDHTVLYAGTNFDGVYRSLDGGQHWDVLASSPRVAVNQVLADPMQPSTVYAATDGGVFQTSNGGNTWFTMSEGLGFFQQVESLAIDPTNSATLYAGTPLHGIFRSANGGPWISVNAGLQPALSTYPHLPLAVTPLFGTVFAGTAAGVFRADSGGINWVSVNSGLPPSTTVFALAIAALPPALLEPTGVFPPSATPSTRSFTFSFNAPKGTESLDVVDVLINDSLDGRRACYLAVVPLPRPSCLTSHCLYLVDDAGDADGPFAGYSEIPGFAGQSTVRNGQCTIDASLGSLFAIGNSLSMTVAMAFSPAFTGNKVVYMAARDQASNTSGWQPMGTVTLPGQPFPIPAATAVWPGRSTAGAQAYRFDFTDPNGYAEISLVDILINSSLDGRHACYAAFVPSGPSSGSLFLVNDAGDAGGPYAGSLTLPGMGTVSNGQCTIDGARSSVSGLGTGLSLTLAIGFSGGSAIDNRVIYAAALSHRVGLLQVIGNSGWQALGTVNVLPAFALAGQ